MKRSSDLRINVFLMPHLDKEKFLKDLKTQKDLEVIKGKGT